MIREKLFLYQYESSIDNDGMINIIAKNQKKADEKLENYLLKKGMEKDNLKYRCIYDGSTLPLRIFDILKIRGEEINNRLSKNEELKEFQENSLLFTRKNVEKYTHNYKEGIKYIAEIIIDILKEDIDTSQIKTLYSEGRVEVSIPELNLTIGEYNFFNNSEQIEKTIHIKIESNI